MLAYPGHEGSPLRHQFGLFVKNRPTSHHLLRRWYTVTQGSGVIGMLLPEESYSSLNELSRAIGAKTENAWMNWFYIDENNDRSPISVLRDHSKIIRRKKPLSLPNTPSALA
jgi:hypothetical protein